ncbi:bifunctional 4-hydroxy-2-oxoglutarate aldolase/2-dehydro-3-deoxy-phosphogluconate aldolase [Saccharopolyspora erythraea]|uniref:bifunctional 4-hydroxy-2-oxoglutarate aldolase/2-dehydro-3-deoxy-phosphogluconate aldolase n=1 Tax=Saccharopolyspora erythraea TaxID=1836 RepID=UPI001BAC36DB|nr:bifunctional 4-hydroxy-2-oxoglutarate aldolase/2-dehydro-3-deoxy-phosphogluconate aldolase [Saccharopolyspora erythraea]QUH04030.1 bifunctional 4-hydroxy-2-oxoglutarate aldolase/2-dehydro-3-deoxy-phosphogluconate aldolase [Saccharopolyspora erythraea]
MNTTLTAIYRGMSPQQCLRLTIALHDLGVRSFEVTMTGGSPIESLRLLRKELGAEAHIGAGTVTTTAEVEAVAAAGAGFVVSPHLDADVVTATKAAGLVSIPGAFTATEIVAARRAGADVVKIFPINAVGADYIRQLRAPLPDLTVMASGGITPQLAHDCVAAGATMIGVGSHLLGAHADGTFDADVLRRRTAEFLDAIRTTP